MAERGKRTRAHERRTALAAVATGEDQQPRVPIRSPAERLALAKQRARLARQRQDAIEIATKIARRQNATAARVIEQSLRKLPAAMRTVLEVMREGPARDRIAAARLLHDWAFAQPGTPGGVAREATRDVSELSPTEVEAMIRDLKAMLAEQSEQSGAAVDPDDEAGRVIDV